MPRKKRLFHQLQMKEIIKRAIELGINDVKTSDDAYSALWRAAEALQNEKLKIYDEVTDPDPSAMMQVIDDHWDIDATEGPAEPVTADGQAAPPRVVPGVTNASRSARLAKEIRTAYGDFMVKIEDADGEIHEFPIEAPDAPTADELANAHLEMDWPDGTIESVRRIESSS